MITKQYFDSGKAFRMKGVIGFVRYSEHHVEKIPSNPIQLPYLFIHVLMHDNLCFWGIRYDINGETLDEDKMRFNYKDCDPAELKIIVENINTNPPIYNPMQDSLYNHLTHKWDSFIKKIVLVVAYWCAITFPFTEMPSNWVEPGYFQQYKKPVIAAIMEVSGILLFYSFVTIHFIHRWKQNKLKAVLQLLLIIFLVGIIFHYLTVLAHSN